MIRVVEAGPEGKTTDIQTGPNPVEIERERLASQGVMMAGDWLVRDSKTDVIVAVVAAEGVVAVYVVPDDPADAAVTPSPSIFPGGILPSRINPTSPPYVYADHAGSTVTVDGGPVPFNATAGTPPRVEVDE